MSIQQISSSTHCQEKASSIASSEKSDKRTKTSDVAQAVFLEESRVLARSKRYLYSNRFNWTPSYNTLNVKETAHFLKTSNLPDHQRFQIANACANKDMAATIDSISDFRLSQSQRFILMRRCALIVPNQCMKKIKECDLSPSQQYEIASRLIVSSPLILLNGFDNLDLNYSQKLSLAKSYASLHGDLLLRGVLHNL